MLGRGKKVHNDAPSNILLTHLPLDVLQLIARLLDMKCILRIALVCKKLKIVSDSSTIWKELYINSFHSNSIIEKTEPILKSNLERRLKKFQDSDQWKEAFRFRYRWERGMIPKPPTEPSRWASRFLDKDSFGYKYAHLSNKGYIYTLLFWIFNLIGFIMWNIKLESEHIPGYAVCIPFTCGFITLFICLLLFLRAQLEVSSFKTKAICYQIPHIFTLAALFVILIALKSDGYISTPWAAIFTPIWILCSLLIALFVAISVSNFRKNTIAVNIIYGFVTLFLISIPLTISLKLDEFVQRSWYGVLTPVWVLNFSLVGIFCYLGRVAILIDLAINTFQVLLVCKLQDQFSIRWTLVFLPLYIAFGLVPLFLLDKWRKKKKNVTNDRNG